MSSIRISLWILSSSEEIDMKRSGFIWASNGLSSVAESANRIPINILNCHYKKLSLYSSLIVDSGYQEALSVIYKIES